MIFAKTTNLLKEVSFTFKCNGFIYERHLHIMPKKEKKVKN